MLSHVRHRELVRRTLLNLCGGVLPHHRKFLSRLGMIRGRGLAQRSRAEVSGVALPLPDHHQIAVAIDAMAIKTHVARFKVQPRPT